MSEIIKSLFDSVLREYLKSGPQKKNYGERLKKMAIVIQNLQFNTSNGKKKKIEKSLSDIPFDVIIEILIFVPYKTIFDFMSKKKYIYNLIMSDLNNFWERKFKSETPSYYPEKFIYPKNLEKWYINNWRFPLELFSSGKPEWYLKTKMFFDVVKHFGNIDYNSLEIPPIFFFKENELLLIEIFKRHKHFNIYLNILKGYFQNMVLNVDFLIEMIKNPNNYGQGVSIFSDISIYFGNYKKYNRKKVVLAVFDLFKKEGGSYDNDPHDLLKHLTKQLITLVSVDYRNLILNDKEIVSILVGYNGKYLKYFPLFQNDKDVILIGLKNSLKTFDHVNPILKNSSDFILEAVKVNGGVLFFAGRKYLRRRLYVSEAVKTKGKILKHVSDKLKKDKDIVFDAVKNDGSVLKYADDSLLKENYNRTIIKKAIETFPRNIRLVKIKWVLDDLKMINIAMYNCDQRRKTIYFLVHLSPHYFIFANDEVKDDYYLIKSLLKNKISGKILFYASKRVQLIIKNMFFRQREKNILADYLEYINYSNNEEKMLELLHENMFVFWIIRNEKVAEKYFQQKLKDELFKKLESHKIQDLLIGKNGFFYYNGYPF